MFKVNPLFISEDKIDKYHVMSKNFISSVILHANRNLIKKDKEKLQIDKYEKILENNSFQPFYSVYFSQEETDKLNQSIINFYSEKCDRCMEAIWKLNTTNGLDEIHFVFQFLIYSLKSFDDYRLVLKEFKNYFDFETVAFLVQKVCFTFAYYAKSNLKELLLSFAPYEKDYIRNAFYSHYKIIKVELEVFMWPFAEVQKPSKTISFDDIEQDIIKSFSS